MHYTTNTSNMINEYLLLYFYFLTTDNVEIAQIVKLKLQQLKTKVEEIWQRVCLCHTKTTKIQAGVCVELKYDLLLE